jgi:hypothetical protein
MLAVGFDEEAISALFGRLDEEIGQLGLQGGMNVKLRLLDYDQAVCQTIVKEETNIGTIWLNPTPRFDGGIFVFVATSSK